MEYRKLIGAAIFTASLTALGASAYAVSKNKESQMLAVGFLSIPAGSLGADLYMRGRRNEKRSR